MTVEIIQWIINGIVFGTAIVYWTERFRDMREYK